MSGATGFLEGTNGPYVNLTDYILGITHEIWESRQLDRIHAYYDAAAPVYTLGGIVHGAAEVESNTRATMRAFPDRLVIGDNVIGAHESRGRFYSSHRISSPMTNLGESAFGPATGKRVVVGVMADCVITNGVITREWLVRDNYGLIEQLGLDPREIAARQAAEPAQPAWEKWRLAQLARLAETPPTPFACMEEYPVYEPDKFADTVLNGCWTGGGNPALEHLYADYAVLHDSGPVASGRNHLLEHYARLREAFTNVALRVDHICAQPYGETDHDVAARWICTGTHSGEFLGVAPTGATLLVLGISHWRIVAGRIAAEWTHYDRLAMLTQLYRATASA